MANMPTDVKKTPWQEISQPFIDLVHAPRALWGINLAYVIEGMVYFGMLGYLAAEGRFDTAALRRALLRGTVSASFTIEDFSLRRVMDVTRPEIDARVDELIEMLRIE